MASRVELAPVPPMTGMRPLACVTVNAMTRLCSAKSIVADSPVVPTLTMAFVPLCACQSTSSPSASQSTSPVGAMGVTSATMLPLIILESPYVVDAKRVLPELAFVHPCAGGHLGNRQVD